MTTADDAKKCEFCGKPGRPYGRNWIACTDCLPDGDEPDRKPEDDSNSAPAPDKRTDR